MVAGRERHRALYEPIRGSAPDIAQLGHPPVSTVAMGNAILGELDAMVNAPAAAHA